MKKFFLGLILIVIIVIGVFYWKDNLSAKVQINDTTFKVDVAVTPREREMGLAKYKYLPQDQGMLFVYDHPELYPFWMKNMRFPIDIVWINGNTIVEITSDVALPADPTSAQQPIYHPLKAIDKVLELNAGVAKQKNLKIGDQVIFIN